MGGGALGDEAARLEALTGAKFVGYGKGAVANGAYVGGAEEGIFEVDRRFVAHRGLGDNVPDPGDVPGQQRPDTVHLDQSFQVRDPGRLEELQVNGVVNVAVGV